MTLSKEEKAVRCLFCKEGATGLHYSNTRLESGAHPGFAACEAHRNDT